MNGKQMKNRRRNGEALRLPCQQSASGFPRHWSPIDEMHLSEPRPPSECLFSFYLVNPSCHIQNLANRHRGVSPSGRGVERCVGHGVRTSTLSASPLVFPSGRVAVSSLVTSRQKSSLFLFQKFPGRLGRGEVQGRKRLILESEL